MNCLQDSWEWGRGISDWEFLHERGLLWEFDNENKINLRCSLKEINFTTKHVMQIIDNHVNACSFKKSLTWPQHNSAVLNCY